jgi:hypothetical protein
MTSDDPRMYNIQVQVNRETKISSLKNQKRSKYNGTTLAKALVPIDGSWDVAMVRQALLDGLLI